MDLDPDYRELTDALVDHPDWMYGEGSESREKAVEDAYGPADRTGTLKLENRKTGEGMTVSISESSFPAADLVVGPNDPVFGKIMGDRIAGQGHLERSLDLDDETMRDIGEFLNMGPKYVEAYTLSFENQKPDPVNGPMRSNPYRPDARVWHKPARLKIPVSWNINELHRSLDYLSDFSQVIAREDDNDEELVDRLRYGVRVF